MSGKGFPVDVHSFLAQRVRKLLGERGPLSPKDIVKLLRREDSPRLMPSGVQKVLNEFLRHDVERLPGNLYRLIESTK